MPTPVNLASVDAWIPTLVAFAVISGAIYGAMMMLKKSVAKSAVSSHYLYKRALPMFPGIMGIVGALLLGDTVTPIAFPWVMNVAAGVLMGALSSNVYNVWEAKVNHTKISGFDLGLDVTQDLTERDSSGSSDMVSVDESDGGELE